MWDDLQNLPFLKAVLMESHRYYSVIQLINRECDQDEEVCGYFIPKGATVWFSPHLINRDPNVYESPNQFLPERFLNKELPSHQFSSFGAGARMCLGKMFAINEAMVIVAMIYQNFGTELLDKVDRSKFSTTLYPSSTVFVKLTSRV